MNKCFLTLIVVCLLSNSSFTYGQDKTEPISKAGMIRETDRVSVYQINFPGGTLGAYAKLVKQMEDSSGEACQMVVTEGAKDFPLPEIEVKTNLEGAIGIMEACSSEIARINVVPEDSNNVWIVSVERDERPQTVVLNVSSILERVDQESMLSAITVGMDMLSPSESVQLKLHEETGLFFAKGSQASCQLVHDIVQQLEMSSSMMKRKNESQGDMPSEKTK